MKRIIMASITAVVVIAVLAGTLIPVLDDATATSDTYTNSGYFRMAKYSISDEFSAVWDYNTPNQITINDVVQSLPSTLNVGGVSIIAGDNYYLRYTPTASTVALYYDGVALLVASAESTTGMTVTVGESAITYAQTGSNIGTRDVTTLTDFFAVASDGDYVMKLSDEAAYLNGDSIIYGCGRTSLTNNILGTLVTGTIDDGCTVTIWRGVEGTAASNIVINKTADSDHEDLYKFTSVTFDVAYTYDETDYTDSLTYSYVVVPYQVTAERSTHFTDGENAIFNAIPVMVIVALLLGVIALVLRSRMD